MYICSCGCGKEIPYKKWHDKHPPKFISGHNTLRGEHIYAQYSKRRITEGTTCGCGCGQIVSRFKPSGKPRYIRTKSGKVYIHGHQPHLAGEQCPHWKGGRMVSKSGYVFILRPEHPQANSDGYVLEHRYIWEQNNRSLLSNEQVHHINGVRDDNRIENLIALSNGSQHQKIHHPQGIGIPATREQRQDAGRKGAKARWG